MITFTSEKDQIGKVAGAASKTLAKAGKATIEEAARRMRTRGRADLAAAGMSKEIIDGLRVEVYPKGNKISINSVAYISHRMAFVSVFEEGATIRGRPLLWVSLPGIQKTIDGMPTTARLYGSRVHRLFLIKGTSGRPILAYRDGRKLVPVFVGLDTITLRKRLHLTEIAEDIGNDLPAIFESELGELT